MDNKITKLKLIGVWKYKCAEDDCVICCKKLDNPQLVVGECKHIFHKNCMEDWLKKANTCPLDRTEWKEKIVI